MWYVYFTQTYATRQPQLAPWDDYGWLPERLWGITLSRWCGRRKKAKVKIRSKRVTVPTKYPKTSLALRSVSVTVVAFINTNCMAVESLLPPPTISRKSLRSSLFMLVLMRRRITSLLWWEKDRLPQYNTIRPWVRAATIMACTQLLNRCRMN